MHGIVVALALHHSVVRTLPIPWAHLVGGIAPASSPVRFSMRAVGWVGSLLFAEAHLRRIFSAALFLETRVRRIADEVPAVAFVTFWARHVRRSTVVRR